MHGNNQPGAGGRTGSGTALLAALRDGLSNASDEQLRRVVAMVDALADRGSVDTLLAPTRPRLADLRPARPLRFPRLLLEPLDPLIVAPQCWTSGMCAVPRTAIRPLAAQVHAAMGADALAIDALIAGHSTLETGVIEEAAHKLWPRAAEILATAPCPPGWSEAGLPAAAHSVVMATVVPVLRQAIAIEALAQGVLPMGEQPETLLERVLDAAAADGPQAWRTIGLLLMLRLKQKQPVLRAMGTTGRLRDPTIRLAGEQAIEAALDHLNTRDAAFGDSLAGVAAQLGDDVALLDGIVADGAGPARQQRARELRNRLDAVCRTKLRQGLDEQVLAPLRSDLIDDDAMQAMECAARGVRQLEAVGRQLGGSDSYNTLLRDAAAQIRDKAGTDALSPMDRARLVELLVGPEAGLAVLDASRSPSHRRTAIGNPTYSSL